MIKANKLVGSCVNQENLLTKKENRKLTSDMYNIYSKKRSIVHHFDTRQLEAETKLNLSSLK